MERTKQPLGARVWKQRYLLAMVIPGVLFMLVFNYAPMYGIVIAFTKFNIVKPIFDAPWVGFKYFLEFFQDDRFWLVLGNTLGISLLKLAIAFPLPIVFALMINEVRQAGVKRWVQTVSYLPHFLSWVVLGGIMINWLADVGLINQLLVGTGLLKDPIVFLADPSWFWALTVISDVWKELDWPTSIYLGTEYIRSIPDALVESARIDGAGYLRIFASIILPMALPVAVTLSILTVTSTWNEFMLINVLTSKTEIKSLPLGIFRFSGPRSSDYGTQFAALAIGMLPMLVFYLAFQKRITQGVAAGAVKG